MLKEEIEAMSFDEKLARLKRGIEIPPPEGRDSKRWTLDEVAEVALSYYTIKDWLASSRGSYMWAYRHGVLEELTEHMTRLRSSGDSHARSE